MEYSNLEAVHTATPVARTTIMETALNTNLMGQHMITTSNNGAGTSRTSNNKLMGIMAMDLEAIIKLFSNLHLGVLVF